MFTFYLSTSAVHAEALLALPVGIWPITEVTALSNSPRRRNSHGTNAR
jgi:hypothetical protein